MRAQQQCSAHGRWQQRENEYVNDFSHIFMLLCVQSVCVCVFVLSNPLTAPVLVLFFQTEARLYLWQWRMSSR